MKKAFLLFALLFAPLAFSQTTYTTTADGCGNKPMSCSLPVTDQNGTPSQIFLDNRAPYRLGIIGFNYGTANYYEIHGAYSGFVANPDGTLNPFNGIASWVSDDGNDTASLQFSAYYVKTCSGRGCGGTLGWHYRILAGSTVNVQ